jgi:hypothetical protein
MALAPLAAPISSTGSCRRHQQQPHGEGKHQGLFYTPIHVEPLRCWAPVQPAAAPLAPLPCPSTSPAWTIWMVGCLLGCLAAC